MLDQRAWIWVASSGNCLQTTSNTPTHFWFRIMLIVSWNCVSFGCSNSWVLHLGKHEVSIHFQSIHQVLGMCNHFQQQLMRFISSIRPTIINNFNVGGHRKRANQRCKVEVSPCWKCHSNAGWKVGDVFLTSLNVAPVTYNTGTVSVPNT